MMPNKEILKKQIIYRSMHRGTKEMDLLLGNFVRKHVKEFNITELMDLESYSEQALIEADMNLEDLSSQIQEYLNEVRD